MTLSNIAITSLTPTATENGNRGIYRISRDRTAGNLTIKLNIDSSSTALDDYNLSGNKVTVTGNTVTVVIPDGKNFVDINLTAIDDIQAEADETVKLNLAANATYNIDTVKNTATITISRNDTVVTNTNDKGEGSLRQAIENANAFAGADTVSFAGTVYNDVFPDAIALTSGELNITDDVTIQGTGAKNLSVSGNNTSRLFNISGTQTDANIDAITLTDGNAGTENGGGILVNSGNTLNLNNSVLSNNIAARGGAISNTGTATITDSTIDRNQSAVSGGGVYNFGTITVSDSTFSNNIANANGGALTTVNTASIINSTISGNQANSSGGGVTNSGLLIISNSTIANNTADADNDSAGDGGGIFRLGGTVTASNTIIANNKDLGGEAPNVFGNITGNANNLIGTTAGASGTIGTGSDIVNPNPGLAPLANNGGTTQTQALLATSPAVNAGNNAFIPNSITTDQRGTGFDRSKFGTVDIGAFEVQEPIVSLSAVSPTATETGTAGTYRVNRIGTASNLTVKLTIDSSSASVNDYTLSGGNIKVSGNTLSVVIPDGQSFVDINLAAIDDLAAEADESLKLNLAPDAAYSIDTTNPTATVTIARNDTTVTNINDRGEGSLRQAIENANIFTGANTVNFDTKGKFATAQTITLTSGQLRITDDISISGTGAEQLTVSGNNANRVLSISGTGTDAKIDGLTIANGNAGTGDGGGILVNQNSNLVLTNSAVEGNRGNLGGGINILGTATVINSTLSNNQGDAGGGILNSGTATVINTTLSGNQARVFGGGGVGNLGTATLINNTITNNTVVANFNSTFGGGVENFFGGTLAVKNTIIAGNINNNNQEADVSTDSDIAGNTNNLIGSTAGASGTIGTGSDITFAEAGITNINQVINPILQNNGGTTATYALVPTSIAINAGNNANLSADTTDLDGDGNTTESIPFDQRGTDFNRFKFATVDIGAYESDTVSSGGGQKEFIVPREEGSHTILNFGGVGRGSNPSAATIAEVDTIKFQGTGLTARNLLLTQSGNNLEVTFEGVAETDTKVTLQNFALENLDNLSTLTGNLLFDGQTNISDNFDVINAESIQTGILRRNTVTFFNDFSNNIKALDNSNDVINGQGGNDIIDGRSGDDLLRGDLGNDTLIGGAGNDILVGGAGNDTLTGGTGFDQFIYQAFSDKGTSGDTITDFNSSQDKLVLTNLFDSLGYSGSNPITDNYLRFVSSGVNTQVQIDTDGITSTQGFSLLVNLNNVSANSLVIGSNVLV